jgi:hypothetical protein
MSKLLGYSFLVILSLTVMWRSPVASAWVPSSTSTRDRAAFSRTLVHHHSADSRDAEINDTDHSRRRFLVQNTMRAAATITASTALTTAHAATTTTDVNDETIQNQNSSSSTTDPDPLATPPKWPEAPSPLPSPWTNISPPTLSEDDNGQDEGTTTDFSRAMQKAGKQKQVDPRTHG